MEATGMLAIVAVLIGSVLVALFVGEALIGWIMRAMSVGVKRADEAATRLSGQPGATTPKLLSGQRARLQRV